MIVFQSNRLVFRYLTHADVPRMVELIGDWDIVKWLVMDPFPYTQEAGEQHLASATSFYEQNDPRYFVLTTKNDDQLIGGLGLRPAEGKEYRAADYLMFYWIGKPYWNMGYATEAVEAGLKFAFDKNKAKRVLANVDPENLPSQNVLAKAGFDCLGTSPRINPACLRGSSEVSTWEFLRETYLA